MLVAGGSQYAIDGRSIQQSMNGADSGGASHG
jgi:hypothetical protein